MTRDYVKRSNKKPPKRITPGKVILLLIVFTVFASFSYWLWHAAQQKTTTKHHLPPVTTLQPTHVSSNHAPSKASDDVDFQFYTMLPKIKVSDPNLASQAAPGTSEGYWLQMAVYYTEKDTGTMVERLQLLGLNPDITQRTSETSGKTLYAVVIGPFANKQDVLQKQKDLQAMHLDSMIYHVDAS